MIDVMVAGVLALVILIGVYKVTNDLLDLRSQAYNHVIARASLLSLESRWRGLTESDRLTLLQGEYICNSSITPLDHWCDQLATQFAGRQLQSRACLRELAAGRWQAIVVWGSLGESGALRSCWKEAEQSQYRTWH